MTAFRTRIPHHFPLEPEPLPPHMVRVTLREALPDHPPPASVVGPASGFLPRVQSLLWLQFHSAPPKAAFGARFTSLVLSPVERQRRRAVDLYPPWVPTSGLGRRMSHASHSFCDALLQRA